MCLILLAYQAHPSYPLILAANRDEFYDRPTAPAAFWNEDPSLLAGRDLQCGGTWLGITTVGKLAAVTNFRNPRLHRDNAPSRGRLVTGFLQSDLAAADYQTRLREVGNSFNPFNLLFGTPDQLLSFSNRESAQSELEPGIYGLSNHLLDTPWPKIQTGRNKLQQIIDGNNEIHPGMLLDLLADRTQPSDDHLPYTGVSLEWERTLAPLFIASQTYGTRSSTVILIDSRNHVTFVERSFNGSMTSPQTVRYTFTIPS